MNVKIKEQDLRFKITEEELNQLLDNHCLHLKVEFPGKEFVVTINPQEQGKDMEPKLVLDQSETYLQLVVPATALQDLSEMGRSRGGLKQQIGGVSVSLQVDVREDSRKVGKR